ncbi:ABC-type transport system, involved in lipoprotein release, permease component [Desulfitobacterium dehalogenans ATCC 51507]|uniref:ABC-type transport system, involved in lipoprotein release, permease component n=1 Tax=Desulfitobacterium dehalogenans (strain ATCC 51507 / DSM 9161 / JW/IU-DC1) TaxID=756499 RepID=I4A4S4_DESDJ|nr:FtsX-like permease family protein [Desulfitobacterium dehalogenans]AFL98958.1 ABC-type transport system, involved in lipoprotein release, permease component [Desulfitobacterium dehalogenans ATCC 51507]
MSGLKLAVRNVRKSYKDYGVYFLTIIAGVAMFYIFNSLDSGSVMMDLNENQAMALLGVNKIMSYLSLFISAILGFLILYANAFLIRRRKKELGIYLILGMGKGKISRILIWETTLVGLVSLVVGVVLGIVLSQGLALLTAKLFRVSVTGFALAFSPSAVWKSALYFGIAFLLVMVFNTANISRQKLIDLIYADKKMSGFRAPRFNVSVALFIISLAILGSAYSIIIKNGMLHSGKPLMISVLLGTAGTFLFFYSFSGFFLKLVRRMEGVYFQGLNLFTLGQLNSRMNTAYVSMSFVCLMLFIAISAISVGSAVAESIRSNYGAQESSTVAGITYISLYIGIVFILACASVLAIAQLSEASDNRARYELLSKLGASGKLLAGSLFKQVSLYFALPLVLSVIHSVVAIIVASELVLRVGEVNILASCLASGLLIIALYGGYFLLTYFSSKRILTQDR